ncbi:glycosyltransferase [Terriglobus sp. ADX1]|uniref:glycosyltransferase n=1 Tax=Terriglobus sp. ADX1 TaxID=2794063 RepID=UPI002FE53694
MPETVAAVVVAFNRKELLVECLEGLLRQTSPVDAIYLIDNASTDGTEAYLRERGYLNQEKIRYCLLPSNVGGAGGFAAGMERAYDAGYDWLWLMDDDAEPCPDALEHLRRCSKPNIAVLANMKVNVNGEPLIYHLGAIQWRSSTALVQPIQLGEQISAAPIPIDFSSFVGVMIRREAIAKVGLPRKEFFIHFDDVDYAVRLLTAGEVFLVPLSKIIHKEKLLPASKETHWGSKAYRRISIEKYAFEFYGIRNGLRTLLEHSPENVLLRFVRVGKDVLAMAIKILLYERDHRLLRLKLLTRAAWDGIFARFDNTIPFELRRRLANSVK